MRFLAMFVAGAALALGITFLTGNLEFGGGSSTEAQQLPECVLALDFNKDGQLGVEDVMMFKDAIENNNPAFNFDGEGDTDIFDVIWLLQNELIPCFQEQQPAP